MHDMYIYSLLMVNKCVCWQMSTYPFFTVDVEHMDMLCIEGTVHHDVKIKDALND